MDASSTTKDPLNEAAAIRFDRARQTPEFTKIRKTVVDRAVAVVRAEADPVAFLRDLGGWTRLIDKLLDAELERELPGSALAEWTDPRGWIAVALERDVPAMREEAQAAVAGSPAAPASPQAPQAPQASGKRDADGCVWVPEPRMAELQASCEKLNKRAAKLGMEPIVLTVVEEKTTPVRGNDGKPTGRLKLSFRVRVDGKPPVVAGWAFLARIEHGDGGNIVSRAPGAVGDLPEELWIGDALCAHCRTRRRRHNTFVIREVSTGLLRQVGRNCLADYLRTSDVEAALALWAFLHELEAVAASGEGDDEEGMGGGGGGGWSRYFDTLGALVAAAAAIRVEGWLSNTVARERAEVGQNAVSTAMTVDWLLDPPRESHDPQIAREDRERREKLEPTPADEKLAADTLEWIRRRLDPSSDYERNLKVALDRDYFDRKNLGLVVSAVQAWRRKVGDAETKVRAPQAADGWVGEVGVRLRKLPATVITSTCWDGNFGTTNLVVFRLTDGRDVKWFATGNQGLDVGERVLLTGTVKKHEEYKGRKVTVVSRCAVEEVA